MRVDSLKLVHLHLNHGVGEQMSFFIQPIYFTSTHSYNQKNIILSVEVGMCLKVIIIIFIFKLLQK